jgi:hypothetical protein
VFPGEKALFSDLADLQRRNFIHPHSRPGRRVIEWRRFKLVEPGRKTLLIIPVQRFLTNSSFSVLMCTSSSGGELDLFRSRISSPALLQILDHWQEVRMERLLPSWSQIVPSRIAAHLTRTWAFKYDPVSDEFTARLAGNCITTAFGISFRGTKLNEIHPPHILMEVHSRMLRVIRRPALSLASGPLFRVSGYVGLGDRMMLPLATDGLSGDGILGVSAYDAVPSYVKGPVEVLLDGEEELLPLNTVAGF